METRSMDVDINVLMDPDQAAMFYAAPTVAPLMSTGHATLESVWFLAPGQLTSGEPRYVLYQVVLNI